MRCKTQALHYSYLAHHDEYSAFRIRIRYHMRSFSYIPSRNDIATSTTTAGEMYTEMVALWFEFAVLSWMALFLHYCLYWPWSNY